MKENHLVEMRGICKYFPGVKALQNVDFTLRPGEVHALMGENGAGKSTLIKVLTGVYEKDGGDIYLQGHDGAVSIKSPQDAQDVGIATVYQEITLCPNLTVAENMYIGRGHSKVANWKQMYTDADKILQNLGIPVSAKQQLGSCSIAMQQMVAIARAVDMDCKVLILDEPTSSLDESEVEKLFGMMRQLKDRGVGIIFVTHFLDQVYEICDRITVMRDGQLVGEYEIEKMPRVDLVAAMLGKQMDDMADIKGDYETYAGADADQMVYEATGLKSNAAVYPFDFHIKKGEVTGFTGLLGSGRSECVRAIFGADHVTGGSVKKSGKDVKISRPLDAMKQGIAYLPEDRKGDGIIGSLSVRENIILAAQVLRGFLKPFSKAETYKIADEYIKLLDIKTARQRHADRVAVGRQPAEGHPGPVAVHPPGLPDPRRAHARHRHRHQGRHPEARPQARVPGHERDLHLLGARRDDPHLLEAGRHARPPRRGRAHRLRPQPEQDHEHHRRR